MVNVGFSWSSLLGIVLAVAGAGLYFLRSVRPGLTRDHDIFFAAVALLCGGILFFQGWRQDPILQFSQFLLTGSAIFFAVESVRLRGVATEQAERSAPIVDDERPVSRVYRAEFDELASVEDRPLTRRIKGTRDGRSTRPDDYEDEVRRRPPGRSSTSNRRSSSDERLGSGDRPRKRRPEDRPATRTPVEDEWGSQTTEDEWGTTDSDIRRPSRPASSSSSRSNKRPPQAGTKPRKSRPPQGTTARRETDVEATPTDYVDYQPIDHTDDESDNSSNFDY